MRDGRFIEIGIGWTGRFSMLFKSFGGHGLSLYTLWSFFVSRVRLAVPSKRYLCCNNSRHCDSQILLRR